MIVETRCIASLWHIYFFAAAFAAFGAVADFSVVFAAFGFAVAFGASVVVAVSLEAEPFPFDFPAIFKAFAKAIKMAVKRDPLSNYLPSTKGIL